MTLGLSLTSVYNKLLLKFTIKSLSMIYIIIFIVFKIIKW